MRSTSIDKVIDGQNSAVSRRRQCASQRRDRNAFLRRTVGDEQNHLLSIGKEGAHGKLHNERKNFVQYCVIILPGALDCILRFVSFRRDFGYLGRHGGKKNEHGQRVWFKTGYDRGFSLHGSLSDKITADIQDGNLDVSLDRGNCRRQNRKRRIGLRDAQKAGRRPFGYEQGHGGFAVCLADFSHVCRPSIQCDSRLRRCNLSSNAGRAFYQNKKMRIDDIFTDCAVDIRLFFTQLFIKKERERAYRSSHRDLN